MSRLDPGESFEALKSGVTTAIKDSFPQIGDKHTLEVEDVEIADKQSSADYTSQKKAKMGGRTWGVPVHATMVLKDTKTGKVIERKRQKVATLPKVTNRYSYIVDGSEFQVDNQWRLKPGVYTKVKENGELDSFFNIKGRPLHVGFDPKTRRFQATHGGSKPPMYPIMKAMGVSDDTLEQTWGQDILAANQVDSRGRPVKVEKVAIDFAKRLDPRAEVENYEQAAALIQENFKNSKLSPDVTKRTLGKPIDHISSDALVRSSGRLLGISRGTEKPDVRDSLMFKDFHGVEDFVGERITGHKQVIDRRIGNNLDRRDTIKEIVSPDTFNRPIKEFFGKVSLASTPTQTNPLKMISGQMRTTIAGEGGVADANRITEEAKLVDPSHFAVLDPLNTPEGGSTGVSLQLALGARKKGKQIVIPLINVKTGKRELVDTTTVHDSVVALPDAVQRVGGKFVPKKGTKVLASTPGNEMRPVKMKDVQYVVPKSSQMFSLATNMVPFLNSDSPNRATMAGRHMEQAIPLKDGEAPLVQATLADKSFDERVGGFASHHAPVAGEVVRVGKDSMTIQGANRKKTEVPLYNNYPLNDKKGFMDSRPVVKKGDAVKKGQLIADSNYTKNGIYAPGTNLRVGYLPWAGKNFEDGVIISETASQKLTSAHMYKKGLSTRDASLDGKKKYQAYYPDRMNKEQFEKLDDDGIVQVGQKVKPGDTLVAALADQQLTTEQQKLRMLHKSVVQPKKDKAITWEEDFEGEVVEVNRQGKSVEVHVKTLEPMEVGDKLCYDEKTEVLTTEGWVSVADVSLEHRVCCLVAGEIQYQPPVELFAYPTGGEMYQIQTQQIDLFVTAAHSMYVRRRNQAEYELLPARDVYGDRVRFAKSGLWNGVDQEKFRFPPLEVKAGQSGNGVRELPALEWDMDTFLMVLGAFLADGNCYDDPKKGNYGIDITKTKEPNRTEIREALGRAGVHWVEAGGGTKVRLYSKQLLLYFQQFGRAADKYIPSWVFNLPKARLRVLFHWLFTWGDGHTKNGKPIAQSTVSARLSGDLQRLALHLGMAANVRIIHEAGEQIVMGRRCNVQRCYDVRIITSKLHPQINHGHVREQSAQTEKLVKNYTGPVYCLEVPGHVLYVRRNGKTVWSGNCGRHGNKGIITGISPDHEMPQTKSGKPMEVLMNPIGIAGRMNVGQVLETAASKVARKTGKPFLIENFAQEDNLAHVQSELKKAGISDKEDLVNPSTGKVIPNIQTGHQYIFKMEHQVGKKMSARDRDAYDHNLVPRGGGKHGAQALGSLGTYAMLAHGARENLREMGTLKSDKAQGGEKDELWGALQAGEVLPPPKTTFAYKKFNGYLNGMGVDVRKDGNSLNLVPLTDAQIKDMSEGELKDPGRILKMRTLKPEKGGLFDEKITGGIDGKKFSHIKLSEPMPNPLFEKAAMNLTGIRGPQFARLIDGEDGVDKDGKIVLGAGAKGATYGPKAVGVMLDQVNVDKDLAGEEKRIKGLKGQAQSESRRKIKYLRNLKKLKMSPREAYMVQNVPVLPPSMRPISIMEDGSLQTDDLNELYKGLGIVNKKMGEFPKGTPESMKAPIAASTYDHLKALTGMGGTLNKKHPGILDTLAGKDSPKSGFAQAVLIKRKQDMTARSTIVPEPSLSLDEAAIPRKAAKEMYKPFIVKELRSIAGATPLQAKKMIEEDDPLARKALERVVGERPLLLKRDPVLHKYGIQAFKAKLTEGKAIKIHPLVCSGFGADFDGDQNVNIVFCLLPACVFDADIAYWEPRRVEMTARFRELVGYVDGDGIFVVCNLEDFPHLEEKITKEHIDFHPVPDGVRVVALDERRGPVLADVSGWSLHRQREVEIVTLGSGRQIITDDDERAVYGVDASSLQWCRRRPQEAGNQFVPVLDEEPWLHDAQREWVDLPHDSRKRLRPRAELSRDLGYFLGAVVGDGWVVYHNDEPKGVALACSVDEIEMRWRQSALALFYQAPTVSTVWSDHDKLEGSNGSGRLTITCAALGRFVASLVGRGAENKQLPPFFASAPTEFWEGLLSGLWDTDGSISWSNAKSKPQLMCNYSSTSLRLQQEIQHLLRMCGVTSTITPSSTPKGKPFWLLTPSIVELHAADGLGMAPAHPQKREALADFLAGAAPNSSMAYSRYRLVPLPAPLARELRTLIGHKEHRSLYATISSAAEKQYVSRDTARRLEKVLLETGLVCHHPLYPAWQQLVHMRGVHFERVKHVEVTEIKEDGYDLTVPGYETFMSLDGIVLSNTMSAFVPISQEAIKEAEAMYPSKNLFSPATHGVMYTPSHEQQVGLFMATQTGKATKHSFENQAALEKAFNAGTVKLTDVVKVGDTKTTLGRVRVNKTLPKAMQGGPILKDLKFQFTKKEQGSLFQQAARMDPKAYPGMANSMKDLGNETASTEGFSFGLEDFKVHKDVRDPILRAAEAKVSKLDASKPADAQKIVDVYGAAMEKIEAGVRGKAKLQKTQLDRLEIAAGIKGNGYRQLTAAPVLFVDGKGDVVPNPVGKSYSEGLDATSYWSATSGGRKGIIQKVQSVREPGYLTKMMTNSVIETMVDTDDCGTDRGINLSIDEPDVVGRFTTADVNLGRGKKIPSGTMLTPDIVTRIKNNKTTAKVVVRSPMRCIHGKGICARCAGTDEMGNLPDKGTNVGVMAAQALGERGTQLALRSFHSGGIYEGKDAKSLSSGGLDRAIDLLYLKQKVKGSATLATSGGKIRRVKKDPAGGYRVKIGDTEDYIPADRARLSRVRVGQTVRKGDPLTKGPVNPHELLPLVGMSRTQGHLAGELHSIYGQHGIRRRNSEVMVRALSGVTKVEDPGGNQDLLPGDFASTTQVYDWNKKNKGAAPVKHSPVLRGVKQIPLDVQEDWMARLNHEHLRSTIVEASQQGWSSDLHGLNPIPPLVHGIEFGKGTKEKPWRY